jgi:predicted esterase YcpF (UPF0227 family)
MEYINIYDACIMCKKQMPSYTTINDDLEYKKKLENLSHKIISNIHDYSSYNLSYTINASKRENKIFVVFKGNEDDIKHVNHDTYINCDVMSTPHLFNDRVKNQFNSLDRQIKSIDSTWDLVFIGYSIGGLYASLMAQLFKRVKSNDNPAITVVAIGTPKFTDRKGAKWIAENVVYVNIRHVNDPVVNMPTNSIYKQVIPINKNHDIVLRDGILRDLVNIVKKHICSYEDYTWKFHDIDYYMELIYKDKNIYL